VDVIAEIAESSQQQHDSVARINKGVNTVSRETQQSAAATEETAAAAEELSAQAENMRTLTGQFQLGGQVVPMPKPVAKKRATGRFAAPAAVAHAPKRAANAGGAAAGRDLIPFGDDDEALLGTF
jgi:methyl-accepting chemotaxis protein